MTQPLRFEGRRVFLRLSDLDKKIRFRAADLVAAAEIKNAKDPLHALIKNEELRLVATDPRLAAKSIPHECENKLFSVPVEDYELVMKRFGSRRNGR